MTYYYIQNGKAAGPLSVQELVEFINSDSLIWCDDGSMNDWRKAKEVPVIANLLTPSKEHTPPPVNQATPPPPPVQKGVPPPVNKVAPPPPVQKVVPPPVNKVSPPPVQKVPPPVNKVAPPPIQNVVPPPVNKVAPPPPVSKVGPPPVNSVTPLRPVNQSQPNYTQKNTSKTNYLLPLGIAALICLGIFVFTNMGNNSNRSSVYDEDYSTPRSNRNAVDDEVLPTESKSEESTTPSNSTSDDEEAAMQELREQRERERLLREEDALRQEQNKPRREQCNMCEEGRIFEGGQCDRCDGSGYWNVANTAKCSACGGTGKKSHVCSHCNGTGWVYP